MIRGVPTRVELKHSDLAEYEAARAQWRARAPSESAPEPQQGRKTQQLERIGLVKKAK